MGTHRPDDYNDMDPRGSSENNGLHRIIRGLLTFLMIALVAVAAVALYFMYMPEEPEPVQVQEPAEEPEAARIARETFEIPEEAEEPAEEPAEEAEAEVAEPSEDEQPAEPDETGVQYQSVQLGSDESIEDLAQEYGLDPRTLISVNQITSSEDITPGMELRIPDRDGKLYTIRAGDSLSLIAHAHGMGYRTLAEENSMDPDGMIYPGQELFIPRITMSEQEYQRIIGSMLVRPSGGEIITEFGEKTHPVTGEQQYPGIEFASDSGSSVSAVMDGRVSGIHQDSDGLGRYIEITHDDGYITVYGHLEEIFVSEGRQISQGEEIAQSGSSGMTLDPVLYFSIERDGVPLDPREFF